MWTKKTDERSESGGNRYEELRCEECEGEIGQVRWGDWEELEVTIDSGAVDTVGPRGIAPKVPLEETDASRNGRYYTAANGTKIAIHGMKKVQGYTEEGRKWEWRCRSPT